MNDSAYAFAVSAVRVRENRLLSRAQLEALVTAPDEDTALRLLEDYGYGGITSDTEAVLTEKLREVTEFVMNVSPNKELLSFLFIKNDFHNLKAAMKCFVSGVEPDRYFLPEVLVSNDVIKSAVNDKRYTDLSDIMIPSAEDAWNALVSGMNGQLCEAILDRAAIEASVRIAEDSGDGFSIGLAKFRRKLSAFMIAYRCAAAGKNADFIKAILPYTAEPNKEILVSAALSGCNAVKDLFEKWCVRLPEMADVSALAAASNALEDEYIASSAYVSMGVSPIISYYVRTEREITRIRVILSCKRCGFSDGVIRERIGIIL